MTLLNGNPCIGYCFHRVGFSNSLVVELTLVQAIGAFTWKNSWSFLK